MERGKILSIQPSGGLVIIKVKNEDGKVSTVLGDNGPTVRALNAAYGGVITAGHTFNPRAVVGRSIEYETDDLGLLLGFNPLD
jgi:hypothetical protein